jgi:hypothetical protein
MRIMARGGRIPTERGNGGDAASGRESLRGNAQGASVFCMLKERDGAGCARGIQRAIRRGILFACATALVALAGQRIHLEPKLFAGETLRYRVVTRTSTESKTTTPIVNPEGGSSTKMATRVVVRLDVLATSSAQGNAASGAAHAPGSAPASTAKGKSQDALEGMRLRATYEESEASEEGEAVDPGEPSVADAFQALQGRSIEFTVGPGGQPTDVTWPEKMVPQQSDAAELIAWVQGLEPGRSFPARGIEVGEKWSSERTLEGMPLTGIVWRAESNYLRDEPCSAEANGKKAAGTASAGGAQAQTCAVILTRFQISHAGSPHADATPEQYRRNGLRTMGKWSGSGESLDAISLQTGLLVSSTQSSTQDTNYDIVSAISGSKIHQEGQTTTETEITLLAPGASAT